MFLVRFSKLNYNTRLFCLSMFSYFECYTFSNITINNLADVILVHCTCVKRTNGLDLTLFRFLNTMGDSKEYFVYMTANVK